jgi:hypothetical protein
MSRRLAYKRVTNTRATDESPEKETGFGSGKNADAYMAPDFDEPLEDFKDYM